MLLKKIHERVRVNPGSLFCKTNDRSVTYEMLDQESSGLAERIRKRSFGKSSPPTVLLLFEQGCDIPIGILGTLKAGCLYVPCDPDYPLGRLREIAEDSRAHILVSNRLNEDRACKLMQESPALRTLLIVDGNLSDGDGMADGSFGPDVQEPPLREAYLLYTSGSSGKPKGVLQAGAHILYFVENYIRNLTITAQDRLTLFSAFVHDAAVIDVYAALLSGAALYPLNLRQNGSAGAWAQWIQSEKITVWHSVPTLFRYFDKAIPEDMRFPSVRLVVLGGERVVESDLALCQRHFPQATFVSLYGQSESSYNSAQLIPPGSRPALHLGTPIDGTLMVVLDEEGKEVAPLRMGQIHIANPGLMLGYMNDLEKTKEVFYEHPVHGRLYRTGDLGRLRIDRHIEYLGRNDLQLKIRGFRIEPEEIESCLRSHAAVREAAAIGKTDEDGDTAIHCFFTSDQDIPVEELKRHLSGALPEYMIPAHFWRLPAMPLTPTGKMDRNRLSVLELKREDPRAADEPQGRLEAGLIEIWKQILNIERIGVRDSFFELGGHSLRATYLEAALHKAFGVRVPLRIIFEQPTIRQLAAYIRQAEASAFQAIAPAPPDASYAVSSAQKRMFILQWIEPAQTAYNITEVLRVEGRIDPLQWEGIFRQIIARHEILRTTFDLQGDQVRQVIHAEVPFRLEQQVLKQESALEEEIKAFVRPFVLHEAPLLRMRLLRVDDTRSYLAMDMHHIIADGASIEVLIGEFSALYQGRAPEPLRIQYKDYSEWQQKRIHDEKGQKARQYWVEQFAQGIPILPLPYDRARPERRSFAGKTLYAEIGPDLARAIQSRVTESATTNYIFFLAMYFILLQQYTGEKEIVVGAITAGRTHADLRKLIGAFLNFMPILGRINERQSIAQFLSEQTRQITDAYEHQDYPFEELVDQLKRRMVPSRNPFFDTMLVYHNEFAQAFRLDLGDVQVTEHAIQRETSVLDLKIDIYDQEEGGFKVLLRYNTELFEEQTVRLLFQHYLKMIQIALEYPQRTIAAVGLLDDAERKKIMDQCRAGRPAAPDAIRVVSCATFTETPIREALTAWCDAFHIPLALSFAPYNQVFQQLLDDESMVSQNTGITILHIRFGDWLRDFQGSEETACALVDRQSERLREILLSKKRSAVYLMPVYPLAGSFAWSEPIAKHLEQKQEEWIQWLGQQANIQVLDLRQAHTMFFLTDLFDPIKDREGHLPFTDEFYAVTGTLLARHICALTRNPFKVIVLDCDQTLWQGVCGEEGPLGVRIPEAYRQWQAFLLTKMEQGLVLTLCSKNNAEDVWAVFNTHPDMVLKKEHIAAAKINWRPKSENIRELARDLNLGTDSFIFIDDNPVECADVMTHCPEVLTLPWPQNHESIGHVLYHCWAFDRLRVTEEDRRRSLMYQEEQARKSAHERSPSLEQFLQELGLQVAIQPAQFKHVGRIAQLTQRTNQFNLNTRQRSEQEVQALLADPHVAVWVVEAGDKFGDYGIVGVVISTRQEATIQLDTFLMSCRALGRGVEEAVIYGLKQYRDNSAPQTIKAIYVPSSKNTPIKEFFEKNNWIRKDSSGQRTVYVKNLGDIREKPAHVHLTFGAGLPKVPEPLRERSRSQDGWEAPKHNLSIAESGEVWQPAIVNESRLKHKSFYLPLRNSTASAILRFSRENLRLEPGHFREYVAPASQLEEQFVGLFADVLHLDKSQIGIRDNFFDLGGNSLLLVGLCSRVQTELNRALTVNLCFQYPTVEGLVAYFQKDRLRPVDSPNEASSERSRAVLKNTLKALHRKK